MAFTAGPGRVEASGWATNARGAPCACPFYFSLPTRCGEARAEKGASGRRGPPSDAPAPAPAALNSYASSGPASALPGRAAVSCSGIGIRIRANAGACSAAHHDIPQHAYPWAPSTGETKQGTGSVPCLHATRLCWSISAVMNSIALCAGRRTRELGSPPRAWGVAPPIRAPVAPMVSFSGSLQLGGRP